MLGYVSTVGSEPNISEVAFKFSNVSFVIVLFFITLFKIFFIGISDSHTMTWKTTQLTKFRVSPLRDRA